MKLKINNTLTKGPRKKIRNQKNKDQIKKNNLWQIVMKDQIENKHKFYKRVKRKK